MNNGEKKDWFYVDKKITWFDYLKRIYIHKVNLASCFWFESNLFYSNCDL